MVASVLVVFYGIFDSMKSWNVAGSVLLLIMPCVPMLLFICMVFMTAFSVPYLILLIGRNTTYAITNKRVLITVSGWFNSSRSYTIANQISLQVCSIQHGDGTGDMYFASCWDKTGDAEHAASAAQNIGFIGISAQQMSVVEQMLQTTHFDQYGASSEIFEPSHGQADSESRDLVDNYVQNQREKPIWIGYPREACLPPQQAAPSRQIFRWLGGLLPSTKFLLIYYASCAPAALLTTPFLKGAEVGFGISGLVLSCIALALVVRARRFEAGIARKRRRAAYVVTDQVPPTRGPDARYFGKSPSILRTGRNGKSMRTENRKQKIVWTDPLLLRARPGPAHPKNPY